MSVSEKPRKIDLPFAEPQQSVAEKVRAKVRSVFASKGQPALTEILPMIGYKADYQDRLDKIRERALDKAEERGRTLRYDNVRANRRAAERRRAKERRKGQRAYDRMVARKAQNRITADNMARAVVGEFDHVSPHIRTNVQAVVDREEAKQRG